MHIDIDTIKPKDLVISASEDGSDHDKSEAKSLLRSNTSYTIDTISINPWSTYFTLVEIPGYSFNSCLFSYPQTQASPMLWQKIIAHVLKINSDNPWIKEDSRSIWHRMHLNIRNRTACGTKITNANKIPYIHFNTITPVAVQQCVICQFDLPGLHAVEFKPISLTPTQEPLHA